MTIITPGDPEYTAGDVLTCSSNGYPTPIYAWTVDGVPDSTTSTQVLEEGGHEYICTATVTFDNGTTCDDTATVTVTAYSKYQQENHAIAKMTTRCAQ